MHVSRAAQFHSRAAVVLMRAVRCEPLSYIVSRITAQSFLNGLQLHPLICRHAVYLRLMLTLQYTCAKTANMVAISSIKSAGLYAKFVELCQCFIAFMIL